MELSKYNKQETNRLAEFAYNKPFLVEVLEKELTFYRETQQFKKLEDTQMFLIKLIDND